MVPFVGKHVDDDLLRRSVGHRVLRDAEVNDAPTLDPKLPQLYSNFIDLRFASRRRINAAIA